MANPLKVTLIEEFCLNPWMSWPLQAFPANSFRGWNNRRLQDARAAWGFFEAVESADAYRRIQYGFTLKGISMVTDPNLWTELITEETLGQYNYGQYLHSIVCPEISWNSQRYLEPSAGPLSLELLIPFPMSVTSVRGIPQNQAVIVRWPFPSEPVNYFTVTTQGISVTVKGSSASARVGGLTNGLPYTFSVTSTDFYGLTSPPSVSPPVIPRTNPSPPLNVSASPLPYSANITWSPPTENGGGPITEYRVTSVPGNYQVITTNLSATVTGLEGGFTYRFTIVATNSFGLDSLPAITQQIVIPSVPDAPTNLTAVPADSSLVLSWTAPTGPVTGYTVTLTTIGASDIINNVAGPYTATGLTNGALYTISVVAKNSAGSSEPLIGNATPVTHPSPPTNLIITPGDRTLYISWSLPSGPTVGPGMAVYINQLTNIITQLRTTGNPKLTIERLNLLAEQVSLIM
jgi:hypothetical protein